MDENIVFSWNGLQVEFASLKPDSEYNEEDVCELNITKADWHDGLTQLDRKQMQALALWLQQKIVEYDKESE